MNKKILGIAVITGAVVIGAGCTQQKHEFDDAKVGSVDDAPQFVMTNLDGYPNVAFRCFTGPDLVTPGVPTGIYTTTREADNFKMVVNDPQCPTYDPTKPTYVVP